MMTQMIQTLDTLTHHLDLGLCIPLAFLEYLVCV